MGKPPGSLRRRERRRRASPSTSSEEERPSSSDRCGDDAVLPEGGAEASSRPPSASSRSDASPEEATTPLSSGAVTTTNVLLLVLSQSQVPSAGPIRAAALGLQRGLRHALMSAVPGLQVEPLFFGKDSLMPDREVLVLHAPVHMLFRLAEEVSLPKRLHCAHGGAWQPFVMAEADRFVGSEFPDSFFTASEVTELLRMRVFSLLTQEVHTVLSQEEVVGLEHGDAHHVALTAAEQLGVLETTLVLHDPAAIAALWERWPKLRPWRTGQCTEIDQVCNYFGPAVAHYFVFMQAYSRWLLFPTICGCLIAGLQYQYGDIGQVSTDSWGWNPFTFAQLGNAFLHTWATLFVEQWKRKVSRLRQEIGENRPRTTNEILAPLCFELDGRDDYMRETILRYSLTVSAMFLLVMSTGVLVHFLLLFGDYVEGQTGNIILQNCPVLLYLGAVALFESVYEGLADWLTSKENHLINAEKTRSLTMKSALFHIINNHGWFLFVAFWKQDIEYLRNQLFIFFTVKQILGNFTEVCVPKLKTALSLKGPRVNQQRLRTLSGGSLGNAAKSKRRSVKKMLERTIEENFVLPEADIFSEYVEMAVMFATVCFYAPVFPLAPLFALIHVISESNSDAYKLCEVQRRLMRKPSDEVALETWISIFEVISLVGVAISTALIWVAHPSAWTLVQLVILEHLVMFFKGYLSWSIPDCPERIQANIISGETLMSSLRKQKHKLGILEVRPVAAAGMHEHHGSIRLKYSVAPHLQRAKSLADCATEQADSGCSNFHVETTWDEQRWLVLPLDPSEELFIEVSSRRRLLGDATFPPKMMPDSLHLPVTATAPLRGNGVDSGAKIVLEFRRR